MNTVKEILERPGLKTLVVLMIFIGTVCFSQQAVGKVSVVEESPQLVKGIVTDVSGVPLPGVAVQVKGTTKGTTTDINGKFSLYVSDTKVELDFMYLGYKDVTVVPDFLGVMHITMTEDSELLAETVVVGYGKQKKVTVTGALSQVDADVVVKGFHSFYVKCPGRSDAWCNQQTGNGRTRI